MAHSDCMARGAHLVYKRLERACGVVHLLCGNSVQCVLIFSELFYIADVMPLALESIADICNMQIVTGECELPDFISGSVLERLTKVQRWDADGRQSIVL